VPAGNPVVAARIARFVVARDAPRPSSHLGARRPRVALRAVPTELPPAAGREESSGLVNVLVERGAAGPTALASAARTAADGRVFRPSIPACGREA